MRASHTGRAAHGGFQHPYELGRDLDTFPSPVEEFGNDLARHPLLLTGKIQRQMSLAATEQYSGSDPAALALRRLRHIVLRNQHVIGVSHAENFHAHQPGRNHHRVAAIHSDRVDRLQQPSNTLTPLVAEGHVAPDFLDRAARLHTTKR
jgi:hypothetical protein